MGSLQAARYCGPCPVGKKYINLFDQNNAFSLYSKPEYDKKKCNLTRKKTINIKANTKAIE